MNLKPLTNLVGRQVLQVRKHSPVILFAAGVAGVVTTVVLASRATLKLEEVLDETQSNLGKVALLESQPDMIEKYSAEDAQKDRILIYIKTGVKIARLYGPAILVGTASIAALTGSHVILTKRNGALMAAYAVLDKGFRQYRQRVIDKLGPEKDKDFRYGSDEREIIEETKSGEHKIKTVHDLIDGAPSIYARPFDQTCKNWSRDPWKNQFFVNCQQNYANEMLRARGHVFLNEIYDMLGMERTKEGAVVGWVRDGDGDGYIDFGVFRGDQYEALRFVRGDNDAIWLDFNVDGIIFDKI